MTYTIYYGIKPNGIPKIGCDRDYPNRPKTQHMTNYRILEQHDSIQIASDRELQLQDEYGLERDRTSYIEWMARSFNGRMEQGNSI